MQATAGEVGVVAARWVQRWDVGMGCGTQSTHEQQGGAHPHCWDPAARIQPRLGPPPGSLSPQPALVTWLIWLIPPLRQGALNLLPNGNATV